MSIFIYLGTTGTGKTYKAVRDLEALHQANGHGALVIDSAASPTVAHVPRVADLREAILAVWGERKLVRWIPSDEDKKDSQADFTRLMLAARAGGNVSILVDEISFWAKNPEMLKLCRVWRASNVDLLLTGQHVGMDFGQSVLACNPTLYLYRLTAPRSIEFATRWLTDPETGEPIEESRVRNLGLGEFLEFRF